MSAGAVVFFFGLLALVGPVMFAIFHVMVSIETLNFRMHNILPAIYYPLIYIAITLTMAIRSKCGLFGDDHDKDLDPNTIVFTVGGPPGENGTSEVGGATPAAATPPRASLRIAHGNKVYIVNVI